MTTPLLELDHVSVLRGERRILDDLSLTIAPDQHTVILGANGSGKSTLVRLIAHQIHPLGGVGVRVFGQEHWNVFELRTRLGIVSSALQSDFAGEAAVTSRDAVLSGFFASHGVWRHHQITEAMTRASDEALERMGVARLADRWVHTLSTGEARRVLIARALVNAPAALLLDEPCAGLDPATRRRFLDSLRDLARSGITLLLVTHHVEEILPEITHVVMLQEGRLKAHGPRDALLTDDAMTDLFDMNARLEPDGDWLSLRLSSDRPEASSALDES